MGVKTESAKTSNMRSPAPGTYDPNPMFKSDGFTRFSQGRRRGMIDERKAKEQPGPFEYQPDTKSTKQKYP